MLTPQAVLDYLGKPESTEELKLYSYIESSTPPDMVSLDDAFNLKELSDHVEDIQDYSSPLVGAFLLVSLLRLDAALSKTHRTARLGTSDFTLILSLVTGIMKVLEKDFPKKLPKGDAGIYLVARLLVTRLEERNPGIAESVGL